MIASKLLFFKKFRILTNKELKLGHKTKNHIGKYPIVILDSITNRLKKLRTLSKKYPIKEKIKHICRACFLLLIK